MKAILYINYVGKLHRSAELDVPDGLTLIDMLPDPRMSGFKIFGVKTTMPRLKFMRVTGPQIDEVFEGAPFVAHMNEPIHETGSPI